MDYETRLAQAKAYTAAGRERLRKCGNPPGQKFPKGSRVRVADDLGPSMWHFPKACNATVVGTYAQQFGGEDVKSYTLDLDGRGECSWYHESQLTLICDPADN